MPDKNTSHLPILDDIIKPGDTGKMVKQPSGRLQQMTGPDGQASEPAAADPAPPGSVHTPSSRQSSIAEPVLEDVIATYRPNIDSLTEEVLASVMTEMEPLLREKIRECLKQHFPDTEEPR